MELRTHTDMSARRAGYAPGPRLWRMLEHLQNNLTWLREDGYRMNPELLSEQFHLDFAGDDAFVAITLHPQRRELEIWIGRTDQIGLGHPMQTYLEARDLPAPPRRFPGDAPQDVAAAIDQHTAALKLLRHHELAGNWLASV